MMGLFVLLLIMATTAAMLVFLRMPRMLWPLAASMLMLGAAGYAFQGERDMPGNPVSSEEAKFPPSPAYLELRTTFFGRFTGESVYFGVSDMALSTGSLDVALRMLTGGVDAEPRSTALWTELGNVIALHDRGIVSPASYLAYRRAMQLSPRHPGPPFFLGLAYVRSGEFAKARSCWLRALALTPKDAPYRVEIEKRLVLLDAVLAQMAKGEGPPAP